MSEFLEYPMNGGDSLYSYRKYSSIQKEAIDAVKELIREAILEKLDIKSFSTLNTFRVTDFGCSIGPNTFQAVQNILDAIGHKYQIQEHKSLLPEFHVFFSDHTSNDFNALFRTLPQDKRYYAAGVPGSFHLRLFPKDFLHFAYSSYALQWLSKVPEELVDMNSPAWNKGRILYSNSADQVAKAFTAQYAKDFECFLNARAQEIVCGGLMALVIPGRLNGIPHPQVFFNKSIELLGSLLMDMANKGIISEDKVDSFNLPVYIPSLLEVEAIVKANKCFSIERMENLSQDKATPKVATIGLRSSMEGIFREHFGEAILDELFDSYCKILEESSSVLEPTRAVNLFVSLKRKATK